LKSTEQQKNSSEDLVNQKDDSEINLDKSVQFQDIFQVETDQESQEVKELSDIPADDLFSTSQSNSNPLINRTKPSLNSYSHQIPIIIPPIDLIPSNSIRIPDNPFPSPISSSKSNNKKTNGKSNNAHYN
jgi:hypothetical protein